MMYIFQFCPRYTYYFSFFFGCIFRLFIFLFFRIRRIQSIVLLLIFTMPPNINHTGHIIIAVHMHMGECITLASLSLRCFLSYSFVTFINSYLLLYLFTSPIPFLYQSYFNFVQDCPHFFTISPHFSIPITLHHLYHHYVDTRHTPHPTPPNGTIHRNSQP